MKRVHVLFALCVALVLVCAGALELGAAGPVIGGSALGGDVQALVLWELRIPRLVLALMAGGVLGLSGAVLQGLLRNPLADPGLLGISGAGALGGVVALYFGLSAGLALAMPLAGLVSAGLAILVLLLLAGRRPPPATLILAGLALNALVGALTWLALSLAPSPFAAAEALTWLMGTLEAVPLHDVLLVLPFVLLCVGLLLPLGRGLDALALGEETAASLGARPQRVRLLAVIGVALGTGAIGAVAGALAFVGLVVPHTLRPLVGPRPSALLLPSLLGGALLVAAADLLLRTGLADLRLQLGVLTSLIGAPVFLLLVMKARRS